MGVVQSVLYGQATRSGMRVEIQLSHNDPASPYWVINVDYDHLVHT
jgi:hypothetical protein